MDDTKNQGLVIWLTGLPCSGKTTISMELEKYLKIKNVPVQRLDSDIIRATVNSDLGFSKKDRDENIRRVTYIANILAKDGITVIVAFVSPYQKMRNFARRTCPNFIEIFVKCGLEECMKRDVKGMYKKALAGEITDFTGVQDPYEEPERPEVLVDTEKEKVPESSGKIVCFIEDSCELFIGK